MEAVRKKGEALQYAAPFLRADRDVVRTALERTWEARVWVDARLRREWGLYGKKRPPIRSPREVVSGSS